MERTIIDVRSEAEFMGGHADGSINIPVHKIPQSLSEIKEMKNIVVCCASGGRSAQAAMYLKQNGVECEDAGSWFNV